MQSANKRQLPKEEKEQSQQEQESNHGACNSLKSSALSLFGRGFHCLLAGLVKRGLCRKLQHLDM